ncbi:MAG: aspartate 1-decarboxylase [Verrucomicrobia bacterium A1]|nr:MAG: aspartate 1-decarboxylase [Verrucomicrobia bacterium A1]
MRRTMLKSKIHRATLTGTELHYQGSITVDEALLEAADILHGEQVHVLNVNTGDRLVTYAITAPRGSGTVLLNGPAARMGMVGDPVVILTYCELEEEACRKFKPVVVLVDAHNRPRAKKHRPK